jgi:hypothetical protein
LLARRDITGKAGELGINLDQATLVQQHLAQFADSACNPVPWASTVDPCKVTSAAENQPIVLNQTVDKHLENSGCVPSQHPFQAPLPLSPAGMPGKGGEDLLSAQQQNMCCGHRSPKAHPGHSCGKEPEPAVGTERQQHAHPFDACLQPDCVV